MNQAQAWDKDSVTVMALPPSLGLTLSFLQTIYSTDSYTKPTFIASVYFGDEILHDIILYKL